MKAMRTPQYNKKHIHQPRRSLKYEEKTRNINQTIQLSRTCFAYPANHEQIDDTLEHIETNSNTTKSTEAIGNSSKH